MEKQNPGDVARGQGSLRGVREVLYPDMAGLPTPPAQNPLAALLESSLSADRMTPYRAAVGGDLNRAIALYEWNAAAAGAFHEVLGHLEVLLRNAIHVQLSSWHTANGGSGEWYDDPSGILDPHRHSDIADARYRLVKNQKAETSGRVIAELMFGFWRFLLGPKYQTTLWAQALRHAFPHLGTPRRQDVYEPVERLNRLRNRIAHHEPIHSFPLAARHQDALAVASYIDPALSNWLARNSRFSTLPPKP